MKEVWICLELLYLTLEELKSKNTSGDFVQKEKMEYIYAYILPIIFGLVYHTYTILYYKEINIVIRIRKENPSG